MIPKVCDLFTFRDDLKPGVNYGGIMYFQGLQKDKHMIVTDRGNVNGRHLFDLESGYTVSIKMYKKLPLVINQLAL